MDGYMHIGSIYTLNPYTNREPIHTPPNGVYGNNGNPPSLRGDLGTHIQKQQMNQYCAFEMGKKAKKKKTIQNKTHP